MMGLGLAAARIRAEGLTGIEAVWLDGFRSLPDPELEVIAALAEQRELFMKLVTDARMAVKD